MRLPDFIIIGAMKSGTTSLFTWLADQPECSLPTLKEPNFFSDEWNKGLKWYSRLFARAGEQLTGEASVRYTSLRLCRIAAHRMASLIPDVRLIYIVRHPLDRLRSHYRHLVRYRWMKKPLAEALLTPEREIAARSLYYQCLAPYMEAFPRKQICVVRFEDLVFEPWSAWAVVLAHIGLEERPAPGTEYNVSRQIPELPTWAAWLQKRGVLRAVKRLPRPIRHYGREMLARKFVDDRDHHSPLLESSKAPIPREISEAIWNDTARLEEWLGVESPLWER